MDLDEPFPLDFLQHAGVASSGMNLTQLLLLPLAHDGSFVERRILRVELLLQPLLGLAGDMRDDTRCRSLGKHLCFLEKTARGLEAGQVNWFAQWCETNKARLPKKD